MSLVFSQTGMLSYSPAAAKRKEAGLPVGVFLLEGLEVFQGFPESAKAPRASLAFLTASAQR